MEMFKDHWLLAHAPDDPLEQLSVYRLTLRDGHWFTQPFGDWQNFAGSNEALSSFGLPNTEVVLNTFTHTHMPTVEGPCWVAVHDYPIRSSHSAALPVHLDVVDTLKPYGNMLTVVCCELLSDWEQSPRLTLGNHHETELLQQWANQQHRPAVGRLEWLGLALRLYAQAPAAHQRTRLNVLCLLLAALGFTHLTQQNLLEQHKTNIQAEQQKISGMIQTTTTQIHKGPDWMAWQEQIKRFGEGERTNIRTLSMLWSDNSNIHTHVELTKPRKRLPKGCEPSNTESTQVVCQLNTTPASSGKNPR